MLGDELAAFQRREDIAQSYCARRARLFEAASPTEPGAAHGFYFGQGGNPGLPHACGFAIGGCT
jgi:hypothetical protein